MIPVPESAMQTAEQVGQEIARRGGMTVSGGEKGVMNAVSMGARKIGGLAVGISPRLSRLDAGPYVDVSITTGLGTVRNLINVRTPDSLIFINGGFGTLNGCFSPIRTKRPVLYWRVREIGLTRCAEFW